MSDIIPTGQPNHVVIKAPKIGGIPSIVQTLTLDPGADPRAVQYLENSLTELGIFVTRYRADGKWHFVVRFIEDKAANLFLITWREKILPLLKK